ncbi:MAG: FKBP-type peptidyl-prolyl cis-trans isomerase [Phocaeicola sp.]
MKKSILKLAAWMLLLPLLLASCDTTDNSVDPYENWEVRNQDYIDSIAVVAKSNLGEGVGEWKVFRSYKLPPLDMNEEGHVNDYVYCKILSVGDGDSPLFTDSVSVNYRGRLINGSVFDQNYRGEYDPAISTPSVFVTGQLITGWTTALQHMQVGDRWELYIPHGLAYGATGSGAILAYSSLYFDLHLRKVAPLKGVTRSVEDESEVEE